MKSRDLIAGIIQFLKDSNRKLKQINFTLTFCLTFSENHLRPKKVNRRARRFHYMKCLGGSVWSNYSDDCFKQTFRSSRSTITFVLWIN